ncbi:MAG: BrnA antitoxin family protein [Candidatus Sulfotelmatobacter sp.]
MRVKRTVSTHPRKMQGPTRLAVSAGDLIAWLKKRGKGYQTRANRILRERMLQEMRRA